MFLLTKDKSLALCMDLQASFEAAQLPPVHQTKPGMKALKVLPGQLGAMLTLVHCNKLC